MEQYSQVPVIQCGYNLNLKLQTIAANFPANFRHTVGKHLAAQAAQAFSDIVKTNTIRQHTLRLQAIDDLNTPLFTLSLDIRLAKDLKLISLKRHAELNEILLDIKRQLSGWKRWTQKQVDAG